MTAKDSNANIADFSSDKRSEIERAFADLKLGAKTLTHTTWSQRIQWVDRCAEGVGLVARDWVEDACDAKRIPTTSTARAEEVTSGPIATLRFLRLLSHSLRDVQKFGSPRLPKAVSDRRGQCRVPVFPTGHLYDSILFWPMHAETWLASCVSPDAMHEKSLHRLRDEKSSPKVLVVLGAGNVSSIPATDALSKIFIENASVLLKMNPVNEYLGKHLGVAFKPLIDANLLRIIYGGIETGRHVVEHEAANGVHVTGSEQTHDKIVWGYDGERDRRRQENKPRLKKQITSELGNVSPWLIVPGNYSKSQLQAQAETIASSIVNNASFNCIATKLIVTCQQWPQRKQFLDLLDSILLRIPSRYAYYPGASQRFERFSGDTPRDQEYLPWKLRRGINPNSVPHLLREESFTCVCGEFSIDANSGASFLRQSVELANQKIWGTLAANLTMPNRFRRQEGELVDEMLGELRYGTIGINQWAGVSFALMSPPWGGFPNTNLQNVQSGIGFVHNTFLLDEPQKTVLSGPLRMHPKPIWYSTHRHPEKVAWDLLELYLHPSTTRLPKLMWHAATG